MRWIPTILGAVLIVAVLAVPAAALVWEGTLVDDTGSPIDFTEIFFTNQDTRRVYQTTTDTEGKFRIDLPKGGYRCAVYKENNLIKAFDCGTIGSGSGGTIGSGSGGTIGSGSSGGTIVVEGYEHEGVSSGGGAGGSGG